MALMSFSPIVWAGILSFIVLSAQSLISTSMTDGERYRIILSEFLSDEGIPIGSYGARHLNQLQLTADGNHQANQYVKNTDILNFSLYRGRAHFMLESEFQKYLESVSGAAAEVFTCHSFISCRGPNSLVENNMYPSERRGEARQEEIQEHAYHGHHQYSVFSRFHQIIRRHASWRTVRL
jgi:hypothetical protein